MFHARAARAWIRPPGRRVCRTRPAARGRSPAGRGAPRAPPQLAGLSRAGSSPRNRARAHCARPGRRRPVCARILAAQCRRRRPPCRRRRRPGTPYTNRPPQHSAVGGGAGSCQSFWSARGPARNPAHDPAREPARDPAGCLVRDPARPVTRGLTRLARLMRPLRSQLASRLSLSLTLPPLPRSISLSVRAQRKQEKRASVRMFAPLPPSLPPSLSVSLSLARSLASSLPQMPWVTMFKVWLPVDNINIFFLVKVQQNTRCSPAYFMRTTKNREYPRMVWFYSRLQLWESVEGADSTKCTIYA